MTYVSLWLSLCSSVSLSAIAHDAVLFVQGVSAVCCYFCPCVVVLQSLMLFVGRQEGHSVCKKTDWWGAGMVICLRWGADLRMAQLTPLPLTVSCFSKCRLVLPFWYRLTWVVPDKGPLSGCVCVCGTCTTGMYVATYFPTTEICENCHHFRSKTLYGLVFTMWCCASLVHLSVTSQNCCKMATRMITETTQHDLA